MQPCSAKKGRAMTSSTVSANLSSMQPSIAQVVEQGVAEVKAPDVKFDFEENTVTVDSKKYTYDGVAVDKDGITTSIRVIDENGNVRHLRSEEVVLRQSYKKKRQNLV